MHQKTTFKHVDIFRHETTQYSTMDFGSTHVNMCTWLSVITQ